MAYKGPATGLYTSPNPFNASPDGSLEVADDVQFTAPNVLEPRRGLKQMSHSTFGTTASRASQLAYYNSALMMYDNDVYIKTAIGSNFSLLQAGVDPVGANRLRFEGAAQSMFFNAAVGVEFYDGVSIGLAGCPQGPNITATNASNDGWQSPDTAVAYRFTICRKDAFGRIIEGPPSGRVTLKNQIVVEAGRLSNVGPTAFAVTQQPHGLTTGNTIHLSPGDAKYTAGNYVVTVVDPITLSFTFAGAGGVSTLETYFEITRSATVTCWLPTGTGPSAISTSMFLRVYRSEMTSHADINPLDDMRQCYESAFLSAAQIAAKFVTFNDVAPEGSLFVPLYTNTNDAPDGGALAAKFRPPAALDLSYYANAMWYANTFDRHSSPLTLIGCGAPDGLQGGDTITINFIGGVGPVTFTAVAVLSNTALPALSNNQFYVYTFSDPGFNIQQTAKSLCQAINISSSQSAAFAYYESADDGAPGVILIVAREFGFGSAFQLSSSRSTPWTPQLPITASPQWTIQSVDNAHPARIYRSILQEPEAVPLLSYDQVDADNHPIVRIFPLQYRMLIFKTDGIWFSTNVAPYSIQKLSDHVLIAPDSVARLGDSVYALTDVGVVEISSNGVQLVSTPVDDLLKQLGSPLGLPTLRIQTYGVAYRTMRQYILFLIELNDDGTFSAANSQALVYSTLNMGWTRYTFGAKAAVIDPVGDQLIVATTDSNHIAQERKLLSDVDYADQITNSGVLTAVSGTTVTPASITGVGPGDALLLGESWYLITSVDPVAGTLETLGATGAHASDAYSIEPAIRPEIVFNTMTGGEPAVMKMSQQTSLMFRKNTIRTVTANFSSEITPAKEEVDLTLTGWGEFAYGEVPYGNPVERVRRIQPMPIGTSDCCQLSAGFRTGQAFAKFEFLGIDVRQDADTDANHG